MSIFNPEHDIVLALDAGAGFTPPKAARRLRQDLSHLPSLWGASEEPSVWGWDAAVVAELLKRVQDVSKMEDIPKDLPILITGGKEDPVGSYAQDLQRLYSIYKNERQMKDVELKLYDGMRHELQQEIGREVVFEDQYQWIRKVLGRGSEN